MNNPSPPLRDPSQKTDSPLTGESADPLAAMRPGPPRKQIPAWLLSFVSHLLLFGILLFALSRAPQGAAEVENRTGGIVLVDLKSETTEFLSEGDTDDTSSPKTDANSPPPAAADLDLPPELPGFHSSANQITGVGDEFTEALPGADSMLEGTSNGGRVGGKLTTEVFGIKGTGSRFVYVFDRSASMEGYSRRPLRAAKQQLLASLKSLGESHQFQIIFYNDQTLIFKPEQGPPKLYFANDNMKTKAERFVRSVRGDRGTDHVNALKAALRMNPDVVFMLTDAEGGFTRGEMSAIANWNRSGAVINTIEFGSGSRSTDQSLARLARENGGQYVYKNINTLRLEK